MTVIAMTREMGSLGRDVALALAEELGLDLVQHQLVEHVADKMHLRENSVNRFLEGKAGLLERWGIDEKELSLYTTEEILQVATRGNVLVRGWGATYVLRKVPHVLCVRICASEASRVAVLMRRIGIDDPVVARKEILGSDAAHLRTMQHLFHGNPLEHLDEYLGFTESSFLVDVGRFKKSSDPAVQDLGERWQGILSRNVEWKMACERSLNFHSGTAVHTSIFSEPELVEKRVRTKLPAKLKQIPLRIDVARHYHRPSGRLPAGGQNFLLDQGTEKTQELHDDELFRALPVSFLIFRIYTRDHLHDFEMTNALNAALGEVSDSKTNM